MTFWRGRYCGFGVPPSMAQLDRLKKRFGDMKILEVGAGVGLWSAVLRAYGLEVRAVDPKPEKLRNRMNFGRNPDKPNNPLEGPTGPAGCTGRVKLTDEGGRVDHKVVDEVIERVLETRELLIQAKLAPSEVAPEKKPKFDMSDFIPPCVPKGFMFTEVEKMTGDEALDKYPDTDVLLCVWPEYSIDLSKFRGRYIVIQGEDCDGCTHINIEETLIKEWNVLEVFDSPRFEGMNDCLVLYERPGFSEKVQEPGYVRRDGQVITRESLEPWVDRALARRLSVEEPREEKEDDSTDEVSDYSNEEVSESTKEVQ